MIRFKNIRKVYPNGLTWANYYLEDIEKEEWKEAITELIEIIKEDSPKGWQLIFNNMLSVSKNSIFFPVIASFQDWKEDYSVGGKLIKFISQQYAIVEYYKADIKNGEEAGERIYPSVSGKGSRWLFGHQMERINGYSKKKLLELLFKFSALGNAIPIIGWENSLEYGEKIKTFCKDYREYLKIGYLLPPPWYILRTLNTKSWLKVLEEAGILEDGLLKTSRGYRCVAKDGHECNSLVELEIDNWFYSKGIAHNKEPLYPMHKVYNPNNRLRADFKVENLYIEYAGLMDDKEYSNKIDIKKILSHDLGIDLCIIMPRDFKNIDKLLKNILRKS